MPTWYDQAIGEFTGLEAALKAIAGHLAIATGQGNDLLKRMHTDALQIIATQDMSNLQNRNVEEIRGRAEHLIDRVFADIRVMDRPTPES